MTFDFVLGTVTEFIDYAQIIVAVFFIYYVYKFFTFEGPDADARRTAEEARIGAAREWIGGKVEESKRKKEGRKALEEKERKLKRKKDLVSPIKKAMIDAISACDEVVHHLDAANPSEAKHVAKLLKKAAHDAWEGLKLLRKKVEGNERQFVDNQIVAIEVVKQEVHDKIIKKNPPLRADVIAIRSSCGLIIQKLEQFHHQ